MTGQPHIVVEVALKDVPEVVATIERYADLRKACKTLLVEVYIGEGQILCPAGMVGPVRKIMKALRAEEKA